MPPIVSKLKGEKCFQSHFFVQTVLPPLALSTFPFPSFSDVAEAESYSCVHCTLAQVPALERNFEASGMCERLEASQLDWHGTRDVLYFCASISMSTCQSLAMPLAQVGLSVLIPPPPPQPPAHFSNLRKYYRWNMFTHRHVYSIQSAT
jgi:hypothetical protein